MKLSAVKKILSELTYNEWEELEGWMFNRKCEMREQERAARLGAA